MTSCLNQDYLILIFIHFPYLLYEKSIVYYRLCRDRIFFDKILVSEYKLFKRSNKANLFFSPGPVACFSDKDDVSRNQNNCYWPLHSESIARYKHHMQEKLVYCCIYLENL
jgi:hypothetical protein